jgi:lysophospholipase L1-like esterase
LFTEKSDRAAPPIASGEKSMEAEELPKKGILCYGDSNTWGYVPGGDGARFPSHVRWPGVLTTLLRTNARIVAEGLRARTTVWDDRLAPGIERNGLKTFGANLDSHKPLDLVIIFLGTNDLKKRFSAPAVDIAAGVEQLVMLAANPVFGPAGSGKPPAILTICPLTIWEVASAFGPTFKGGREKSQELRHYFHQMSKRTGVPLMYAEDFIHTDPADGIHLSEESHGILGQEVAKWILEWFDGA